MKTPVNVAITGAAGQIGYALAFRVASGQMLGPDQWLLLMAESPTSFDGRYFGPGSGKEILGTATLLWPR